MTAAVAQLRPRVEQVWLSPAEVCDLVPGMTVANLQKLRNAGRGPAYSKPTLKTVVYSRADVQRWVEDRRVTTREQS